MASPKPAFWRELNALLAVKNRYRAGGYGVASFATQAKRAEVIHASMRLLYKLGYRIPSPRGFGQRHMRALATYWEAQGLKDIQTRISILRTFANEWLGKRGMIGESWRYVINPESVKRKYVTNLDKTWTGHDVDPVAKIEEIRKEDQRTAMALELMFAFGLRIREAILLRPHRDVDGELLRVTRGTKGGRPRTIPIDKAIQDEVLARARQLVVDKHGCLVPRGCSMRSYYDHVNYVSSRKLGLSRKNGTPPHGLRHEYLAARYEELTGAKAPIRAEPDARAPENDLAARRQVAEEAGHSRPYIAGCYVGTWRLAPPRPEQPTNDKAARGETRNRR